MLSVKIIHDSLVVCLLNKQQRASCGH